MRHLFPVPPSRVLAAALLAAALLGAHACGQDKDVAKDTTPKLVKFSELIEAIKAHKGKVVVVDFWADT
jgi:hypothetical protein